MEDSTLFSLEGKTAVVTGAAQGLGREIALALAKSGADLVLSDIQDPKETATAIQKTGVRSLIVQADITAEDLVEDLAKKAVA